MAEPASHQTRQTLECIECEWTVLSERWRPYLTDDDPADAAAYCAVCAQREFG
jgi:hypothetical protein